MKSRLITLFSVLAMLFSVSAQNVTWVSPAMSAPYQVTSGTVVTIQWDYFSSVPSGMFSFGSTPDFSPYQFSTNPAWTSNANIVDNGNGTFNVSYTITADTWLFGGYSTFSGWAYSNVIPVQVVSGITITSSDSLICPTNGSNTLTAPSGYVSYQWFKDNVAIPNATSDTYIATDDGSYFAELVNAIGATLITNTLLITDVAASYTGSLSGAQLTLTSDQSFDSYQWLSGTDSNSLSPIAGATGNQYMFTLPTAPTYYALEATYNGCVVQSAVRQAWDSLFILPILYLSADSSAQGTVCQGANVSLSTQTGYQSYEWYRDNNLSSNGGETLIIGGAWQNGDYHVKVFATQWPEIPMSSNIVTVNILQLIQPSLSGANYFDYFCQGDDILVALTDEGYTYTWYLHDSLPYTIADTISVPTGVYNHSFNGATYLTVVAEYLGCTSEKQLNLRDYNDISLAVNFSNFSQQYLCVDSTVNLSLGSWMVADFQNFQWYEDDGNGNWLAMVGEDSSVLEVSSPGIYRLSATPIACPSAVAVSSEKEVFSYLDREPNIYALDNTTCLGDTATAILAAGTDWTAIQWLKGSVQAFPESYQFLPLANNTASSTQAILEWGTFVLKAKHMSCPNGLKVTSNSLTIKPKVNPQIQVLTPLDTLAHHLGVWDSITYYGACQNQAVQLTLPGHYDSYQWYEEYFSGVANYDLGTAAIGQTSDTANLIADTQWITVVVDSMGCVGHSTPILLDTYVFLNPAIASYDNSELCNSGDSALLHLGFAGEWESFEWLLDGTPVPNSNNDTLWATEPGVYVLNAYPEKCPTMLFSSGTGPEVSFLYAEILENDTLIYAVPEFGLYTYQWYLDGNPIPPHDANIPWVLYKDQMEDGIYTVEVSNSLPCTKLSAPYEWDTSDTTGTGTGLIKLDGYPVNVYPNPTQDMLYVEGLPLNEVEAISLYSIDGKIMQIPNPERYQNLAKLNVSNLETGMYVLRVMYLNGSSSEVKIFKK